MENAEREEFRAYVAGRGAALLRTAVLMTGGRTRLGVALTVVAR